jgi:methyl-accepting chemotaxis protein
MIQNIFARAASLALSAKVTLMIVIALGALSAASFAATMILILDDAEERAIERQETNMRVAWDVVGRYGRDFRMNGDILYAGATPLNGRHEAVDRIKSLVGGTATIFAGDTRITTNVKKDDGSRAVGTKLAPGPTYDAVLKRGEPFRGKADILGTPYFTAYDPIKDADGNVIGVLYVGVPESDFLSNVNTIGGTMAGIALAITILMALICRHLARAMFRPLSTMTAVMGRLADGDTSIDVIGADRGDEIGATARAVLVFRDAAIAQENAAAAKARADAEQSQVVKDLADALGKLSAGDLTVTLRNFPTEYRKLEADFNAAVGALGEVMGSISHATGNIHGGSSEISQASDDLSRRTEQQAASLEETAAAMTEITETVRSSAVGANETNRLVRSTQADAQASSKVVADAVAAMAEIETSSREITKIIQVIDKIAFQTNLLALNASVEAAHAGEAGRAFAVVANEVRALAQRSADAAQEIGQLISNSSKQVEGGVTLVGEAGQALGRIIGSVDEISTLVGQIAMAADQQSSALAQVNTAITEMDKVTQQNASMVEESNAAARSLADEATGLAELVGRFNTADAGRVARLAVRKPARAVG